MMRGLFSGVSGLSSHQTEMDVIGNNIANVNTVGYKSSRVVFEDQISQTVSGASQPTATSGGTNAVQVGLGVKVGSIDSIETQGSLQSTGKDTDIAIEGEGYFVLGNVGTVGQQTYRFTRDGAFKLDGSSNLVSSGGESVLGWMSANNAINTSGALQPLNVPLGSKVIAQATNSAVLVGNLNSAAAVGDTVAMSLTVYDSLGTLDSVTMTFTKSGTNTWDWAATGTNVDTGASTGQLQFDATGALVTSSGQVQLDNTATGATTPQPIALDFNSVSQFSSDSSVTMKSQDGYASGTLESFDIANNGIITGVYSNGISRALGQVAVATFSNPSGLSKEGSSNYVSTPNSGVPNIGVAGANGRGKLVVGNLEMSNVSLSSELTNMIVAERGFQANSKVITTSDEMLQELVNLKR